MGTFKPIMSNTQNMHTLPTGGGSKFFIFFSFNGYVKNIRSFEKLKERGNI